MSSVAFGILLGLVLVGLVFLDSYIPYLLRGEVGLTKSPIKLLRKHRDLLMKHFRFYSELSPGVRKEFDRRIIKFIEAKVFIPRSMNKVTSEMKVCVAASAIQLTYGLPDIYLSHFRYILIYPDEYFSVISHRLHKGEVNPGHRAIVISWKSFVAGYAAEEGINLGLHEMAHALHLENMIRNEEFDFLPADALAKWDQLAKDEISLINSGDNSLFRSYAGTDKFEFFAVAIEYFFERPIEFNDSKPSLFATMCQILNQNPLAQR